MNDVMIGIALVFAAALVTGGHLLDKPDGAPSVEASEPGTDQVVASFERELGQEPGPRRIGQREAIGDDVLYRTLNQIHWSSEDERRARVEQRSNR